MRKDSKNFLVSADYDFKTAEFMLESRRYIYVVFMCHLAIEKVLKAVVTETTKRMAPKTHDLISLAKLGELVLPVDLLNFIAKINNASIPTRYPEDFHKLVKIYPKNVVHGYLQKTKKVIQCLKKDKKLQE